MEEDTYTYAEFFDEVRERVIELSDEEKSTLASLQTTPQGAVLAKVLGPDLTELGSILEPKTKRGLAART
jgi:hypothetical protein|tara:strand:- start:609 stop:818 length:210 start_codon:yes stop_codon:yes gene_type:complete